MIDKKENKNDNRIQTLITLIIILSFCITGATYAYFAVSASDTNTITGKAATVDLVLNVAKVFPAADSDNTGALVPQLSELEDGSLPLETALKNGCVDENKNVVCQVYKITVENKTGTATQVVDGKVLFYSNPAMTTDIQTTMPNLKWKLITSVDPTTPTNSILGANTDNTASANTTQNKFVSNLTMTTNSKFDYYMIVWIQEINVAQDYEQNQTFYGQVVFDSSNGTGVTSTFQS